MSLTPEKRFMRHVCLRNPFLKFLLGIPSIQPLQEATASCPSLLCRSKKKQSHAQKQRVWSLSCGLQDLWQYSDCALRCALWLLQTNDSIVEIELLATVSWTCGCQPFSCRCSQNVMHCRKEINATCLFKESFPAIYSFWEFQASLPRERQHAPRALRYGCIMPKPSL